MNGVSSLAYATTSAFRSGIAVPGFSQSVEELVVNSIDAGAKHVRVLYNISDMTFTVTDDGCGFTTENMERVGLRYSTSKCSGVKDLDVNLRFFGFRGEALASIFELSKKVEIQCLRAGQNLKLSKVVCQGSSPGVKSARVNGIRTNETSISVHGLFATMPVRRKAIDVRLEEEFLLERMKRLALVHPVTSFIFTNGTRPDSEIRVPRHESVLARFFNLFGSLDAAKFMQSVSYRCGSISVLGGISTLGHDSRNLQFVFVNGRTLLQTKVHKVLNDLFKNSCLCNGKGNLPNNSDAKHVPGFFKSVAFAAFYLNIKCPRNEYDITFEPEKTMVEFRNWDLVQHCVRSLATNFLKKNKLLRDRRSDVCTSRVKILEELTTDVCNEPQSYMVYGEMAQNREPAQVLIPSRVADGGGYTRTESDKRDDTPDTDAVNADLTPAADPHWVAVFDQTTGKKAFVSLATGMSASTRPCHLADLCHSPFSRRPGSSTEKDIPEMLSLERQKPFRWPNIAREPNSKLKDWKNPAIPFRANPLSRTRSFNTGASSATRFDRAIFDKVKVVGQLDKKFILCSVNVLHSDEKGTNKKGELLLLFDQHAVHERIRLEYLEKELRDGGRLGSSALDENILLQVSEDELRILEKWAGDFAKVGFHYEVQRGAGRIRVISVPKPLHQRAQKIRTKMEWVQEVKFMIRALIQDQIQIYRTTAASSSTMPKIIFEILCSQACHGAIRFGDHLTTERCEKLLKSLSMCEFPFQCAHGRPSITPIIFSRPCYPDRGAKPRLDRLKTSK